MALRIANLERNMTALGEAMGRNTTAFGNAFQMNDVHLQVLKRVVKELSEDLDYRLYYEEYFKLIKDGGDEAGIHWSNGMSVEEAVAKAIADREKAKEAVKGKDATLITESTDIPTERVFGGDYESKTESASEEAV